MGDALTWLIFAGVAVTVVGYIVLVVLAVWYGIKALIGR